MSEWFCNIAGREIGPLTASQLRAMARSGQLRPDDPIRQAPEGKWLPASCAKGLFPDSADSPARDTPSVPAGTPVSPMTPAAPAFVHPIPVGAVVPQVEPPMEVPEAPPVVASPLGSALPRAVPVPASHGIVSPESDAAPGPFDFGPDPRSRTGRSAARAPQGPPEGGRRKRQQKMLLWTGGVVLLVAVAGAVGAVIALNSDSADKPDATVSAAENSADAPADPADDLNSLELHPPKGKADPGLLSAVQASGAGADAAPAAKEERWSDAATEPAQAGDLEVRIVSIQIGPVSYLRKARSTDATEDCLLVRISVTNRNAEKMLDYASWPASASPGRGAILEDDKSNVYRQKPEKPSEQLVDQVTSKSVYPNSAAEDLLAFQKPVAAAGELRLTLPGATVGQPGAFRFKIARTLITEAAPSAKPAPAPDSGREEAILPESRGGPADIQRGIAEVDAEHPGEAPPASAAASAPEAISGGGAKSEEEEDVVSKVNADLEAVGGGEQDTGKDYSMEEELEGDKRFAPPPDPDAPPSPPSRSRRDRKSADK